MKKSSKFAIFLCGTMAFSLAACQTDELSDNPAAENTQKVYHVTVSADAAQGTNASTRALAVDPATLK